ncbi:hypothetical protein [Endobacterium cereale]|uniref:hypothetical protein n=1 Tax=Endobacterium cereale TaxID=2663029 RepID=UPI002B48CEB0|nr:hypothetical protein [Endobacterium cereale]MEB2845953.1 hypothetical protein [Endobacterium cereale]
MLMRREQPLPVELAIPESHKRYNCDIATSTFAPLDKYVAANDNHQGGRYIGLSRHQNVGKGLPSTVLRVPMPPVTEPAEPERYGDFMQTYTGKKFWPMDPRVEEVDIRDIAHSLAMQCRYAGHCRRFYSVAEHCVIMVDWLLPRYGKRVALHALLHDASEAYLVDIPRPVKPYLGGYKAAELRVMQVVHDAFGLNWIMPPEVKMADERIIADELVNLEPMEWHAKWDDPLGVPLRLWSPERAEHEFLVAFNFLTGEVVAA